MNTYHHDYVRFFLIHSNQLLQLWWYDEVFFSVWYPRALWDSRPFLPSLVTITTHSKGKVLLNSASLQGRGAGCLFWRSALSPHSQFEIWKGEYLCLLGFHTYQFWKFCSCWHYKAFLISWILTWMSCSWLVISLTVFLHQYLQQFHPFLSS